tara:strand:+ start:353 stop:556 length:204 start_codon:yes stop_codon:yes gene_type:complete
MNVDKFGIVVSMIVLVSVLGVAGIGSGEFVDLGILEDTKKIDNPWKTTTSSTDNYYMWCYKMGLECK